MSDAGTVPRQTLYANGPLRTVADQLFEEAKQLPEPLAREALDFVLFLRARHERREWRDLMDAQTTALAETWDNADDEAWNNV